ncbi:hypothetical protein [Lysobacter enzymogenes]|uniref:hypothetical protein n=1 Tax=Lysobacter enzymogenes TaxID=69 RepID=UPI0022646D83|nr:hypothetical protein [Lysobacter enzymogenes]UZW60642.1 hypothetical protein BV903_025905 [Lysobacter enzymogenes]
MARQLSFGAISMVAIGLMSYYLHATTQDLSTWFMGHTLGWKENTVWLLPYATIALGAPALFAMFSFINLLHLSLGYTGTDAVSRERWTRLMGRCGVWQPRGLTRR